MRNRPLPLLRRFKDDDDGAILVIFASFLALGVTLTGGAIDFIKVATAQSHLQKAADAAVLAAKSAETKHISQYGILQQAQARSLGETRGTEMYRSQVANNTRYFDQSLPDPTYVWNNTTGSLSVTATGHVATFFNQAVFPVTHYNVVAKSQAEYNVGVPTEIAIALDNTTSLFNKDGRPETRFTLMRNATLTFVNDVFDSAEVSNNPDAVRVSIIPWATTVNVRGEAPGAKDYSSYSMTTPTDRGSQSQVVTPMDRSLDVSVNPDDFKPVSWRGCITGEGVESKTTYTDAAASGWQAVSFPSPSETYTTSSTIYPSYRMTTSSSCSGDYRRQMYCPALLPSSYRRATFIPVAQQCFSTAPSSCMLVSTYSSRTSTVEPCVADYNEPGIQNNTVQWCPWITRTVWEVNAITGIPDLAGPNENCPAPMLGLSANRKQVIQTVNRMFPAPGGTHQDVGLRWAARTLSPGNGWPAFFGLTTPPKAWSTTVEKVLVLITDGENVQPAAKGFWGTSTTESSLNSMMLGWCTALRDTYKVKIYTVALNVTDTNAKDLLKSCVGTQFADSRAFQVDAANLNEALRSIGRQLTNLRLTN